jgi:hypothetical protein
MWTDTKGYEVIHGLWKSVDFLLKVLGTTGRRRLGVVHSSGDKPRGYPVDIRWTAVDNGRRLDDCGPRPGFVPRLPTCQSPVDNPLTCANAGSPHYAQDR